MRETGYYWVKKEKQYDWNIAYYFKETDVWVYNTLPYKDRDFYEIDERQIKREL